MLTCILTIFAKNHLQEKTMSKQQTSSASFSPRTTSNTTKGGLRPVYAKGPKYPVEHTPRLPTVEKRLGLYNSSAPRDAVNSLSNRTHNQTIWPKPHYVPTVVHRYRTNGSGRDTWIDGLQTETQGIHFVSDTQLYWKSKMGQPEFRGKCKPALCSGNDRWVLYPGLKKVHHHPLIPRAAKLAEESNAMPPVKRTVFSGLWRVVEERNNAAKCDSLLESLMVEQQQRVPSTGGGGNGKK